MQDDGVGMTPVMRRRIEMSTEIQDAPAERIIFQHTVLCQTALPYQDPGEDVREWERHRHRQVEGLRGLSFQVLAKPGFARRTWGLPFLTVLCRSERANAKRQRRHQTVPEKAMWGMRLIGAEGPSVRKRTLAYCTQCCG